MNTVLSSQDWDHCFQESETQDLAQWIYSNMLSLEFDAPSQDAASQVYRFLNTKLLPELLRTLQTIQPGSQVNRILTQAATMITADLNDSNSWRNVSETLLEHCNSQALSNIDIDIDEMEAFVVTRLQQTEFQTLGTNSPIQQTNQNHYVYCGQTAHNLESEHNNGYMPMTPPQHFGVPSPPSNSNVSDGYVFASIAGPQSHAHQGVMAPDSAPHAGQYVMAAPNPGSHANPYVMASLDPGSHANPYVMAGPDPGSHANPYVMAALDPGSHAHHYVIAGPDPGPHGHQYVMAAPDPGPSTVTLMDISYMIPDSTTGNDQMDDGAMTVDQAASVSMPSTSYSSGHNSNYVTAQPMSVTSTIADQGAQHADLQPIFELEEVASSSDASVPKSVEEINQLIETFANYLAQWKMNEQLKEQDIGPNLKENNERLLDHLENRSDVIVGSILKLLPKQPKLQKLLEDFIQTLVVITQEPERVITYKTKFVSKLRILLGPKFFSKWSIVSVVLWNQEKEDALMNSKDKGNGKEKVKKIQTSDKKSCVVSGNRMELKLSIPVNPSRLDKSDGSTVLDEFFWLRYTVKFSIPLKGFLKKSIEITVPATSFPIKVIVHASQVLRAWESVIWGNAAGQLDLYKISERKRTLQFFKICKAINVWFQRLTGRELSDDDFKSVALNLYKNKKFKDPLTEVSYFEFRQENSHADLELEIPPGSNEPKDPKEITFWGWFWHLEKFILKHLQIRNTKTNLWKDGKIIGYLVTEGVNRLLFENMQQKLFVLRFSLGTPNGITVQFYDRIEGLTSTRFTGKELGEKLNLNLNLNCSDHWSLLYCPNNTMIRKDVIFQCDSPPQPVVSTSESEAQAGRAEGSKLSIVLNHCRYVFPRIKLTLQFGR